MRFSVSFAILFVMMALASPAPEESEPPKVVLPAWLRFGSVFVWSGFMIGVVFPQLMAPYKAQSAVKEKKEFFEERLLEPAKTIEQLEALAGQYPDEPAVLEKLAYVYAKEIKDPSGRFNGVMVRKAMSAYGQVLRVDPRRVGALNNLANIQYTIGRVDEALETWRQAVRVDPRFIDGHLNLGKILYTRGELKESAAHFETVLRIDPQNADARVYLKKMVE